MKKTLLTLLMAVGFAVSAQPAKVKIPWDGKKNHAFWQQDGGDPAAILSTASGGFVVTWSDSNSIGRISADDGVKSSHGLLSEA